VFDNSDVPNPQIIDIMKSIPKTVYYTEKKNCGIGYALNYAARWAVNNGYEFLLTMDQDSVASDLMVEKLLNVFSLKDNVGISAAYPLNKFYPKNPPDNEIHNIDRVITSGNLIDLRVYHSVGPFLDDLFIDYVDFEYCFRLRKMNYKIMINNAAIFYHSVGVLKKWNIFGYKFYSTNHPPLRLYYRTRNRFYLRKIYGKQERDFFTLDMKNFFLEIIKIILVESKKIQKLRMIFRGLIDLKKINSVNFKETTEN
jgi:rhamnosyltransferase